MERITRAKPSTKDVFSDPSHRMSQRPTAVKSGEGIGFQDFGSSLNPPKAGVTRSFKSKSKPEVILPSRKKKASPHIPEEESDDELLLTSQTSMGSNATAPLKRAVKGKKKAVRVAEEETVRVDGRVLTAHPDYKPSSFDAIKGLRFTKNKKNASADNDTVAEVPPLSSSPDDSQDLSKPISDDIEILEVPQPGRPSSTRRRSPSTTRRIPDTKDSFTPKGSSIMAQDTTPIPAKPRPRPRLVKKPAPPERDSSPESTPRPAALKRGPPLCTKIPEPHAITLSKQDIKKQELPSSSRRQPQEFPMSLQAKENVSDGVWSSDNSSKTKKAAISRTLPSPLRVKPVSRNTFPNLSPLSSSNDKGKQPARAHSPGEGVDSTVGQVKRRGPKPFPMSTQMLAGISRRSRSPDTRSMKSTKRTSSDDSGAEQGRSTKKRKDSCSGVLDAIDYLQEDDSIELGYSRDPSTLCPYCDEELPSYPTPFFQQLLATARERSASDPRPRNRGGLRAPLTVYISVCQRHRFESHQLPIAAERGWPKTIDFTKVPARVKKMKKVLESIILDKDDISDVEDLDDGRKGPRNRCIFWREMKKEVKKQGSRTVVGVKGQFASFEKTQPGYYGEQGSIIIHQTLFDLFPPSTFDASLIAPLSPAEFIQRILVPEAAARLIAQDLCVDMEDAIVTLRDSAQYGVGMFPDTSEGKHKGGCDDEDEMGVADKIVMERARVRRKELEEEERIEKEMLEEERAAQRAKALDIRRAKAVERAQQAKQAKARKEDKVETEGANSKVSEAGATRVTRQKTRQTAITESESDAMSVDSLASKRPTRAAKKGERGGDRPVRVTPLPDSSDVEVVDDSKRKPNVRSKMLPLQVARNQPGASVLTTRDGWSRNLRTCVPDDTDSDSSDASRRLVRPPIKKGNSSSWLLDCQWSGEEST